MVSWGYIRAVRMESFHTVDRRFHTWWKLPVAAFSKMKIMLWSFWEFIKTFCWAKIKNPALVSVGGNRPWISDYCATYKVYTWVKIIVIHFNNSHWGLSVYCNASLPFKTIGEAKSFRVITHLFMGRTCRQKPDYFRFWCPAESYVKAVLVKVALRPKIICLKITTHGTIRYGKFV